MRPYAASCDSAAIRAYTDLGRQTPGCAVLTLGQPHIPAPWPVRLAGCRALLCGQTGYTPNRGQEKLIRAIAAYEQTLGNPWQMENILVTAGATGALYTAFRGLLRPGEQVVIPTPAFPLYEKLTRLCGCQPVWVPATDTLPELSGYLTDKTRLVVFSCPCNPTGAVYSRQALARLAQTLLGRDIFLILDTAYHRLTDAPVPEEALYCLKDRLLLVRSFSKTWAMTGFRCGWLVADAQRLRALTALQAAQLSCLPPFVQAACCRALTLPPRRCYARNLQRASRALSRLDIPHPIPQGGFYIWGDISHLWPDDRAFCLALLREGKVATVPGSAFGAPGHFRISCCCADYTLKLGLERLEDFVMRLRQRSPAVLNCLHRSGETGSKAAD